MRNSDVEGLGYRLGKDSYAPEGSRTSYVDNPHGHMSDLFSLYIQDGT